MTRTQAQAIIENAIIFGLPDKLYDCDCDCDPVTIVHAIMAAIFAQSIRPAVRDYLGQLEEKVERHSDDIPETTA